MISLDNRTKDALSLYTDEVMEWKEFFNLTGAKDTEEFYKFHIEDSLLPLEYIEEFVKEKIKGKDKITFADLGTGAGLPLIPLTIVLDKYNISFAGIERSHKRVVFLKQVLLKLKNANYIKSNVEILENDINSVKTQFDIVVFRAFRTISDVEKDIARLLKSDGKVFAYKGDFCKTTNELKTLKYLYGDVVELPNIDGHKRTLMILKKK